MRRVTCGLVAGMLAVAALCSSASPLLAQGVITQLPADGTWIRYEGEYTQVENRPESALGKLEIPPWREQVTIKSVGTTMADYQGQSVPCRWIEIKIERGREAEGKIDVGLSGLEIYKVLVPESTITTDPNIEPGVPVGYVPIVRGARQLGKGEPKPLAEPALKLYPLAVLFGYPRTMKTVEEGVDPGTGLGAVSATLMEGTAKLERANSRTDMTVQVWVSKDVPFGVAAWTAKIVRSIKDAQQSADNFKILTEVSANLKARETGTNAQSEVAFE